MFSLVVNHNHRMVYIVKLNNKGVKNMRIPFLPKEISIQQDRFDFIKESRGGGFMLIAGSIFWFLSFALTYILKQNQIENFYIYGGLSVPILGYIFSKLLRLKFSQNQYRSLVAFSSGITVCCLPILFIIKDLNSNLILPILCIINASHLLILCWVHLDYLYAILVAFGVYIGILFIYSIPYQYTHFIGLIWGIISLCLGVYIHINTKNPLQGYKYIIITSS